MTITITASQARYLSFRGKDNRSRKILRDARKEIAAAILDSTKSGYKVAMRSILGYTPSQKVALIRGVEDLGYVCTYTNRYLTINW